MSQPTGKRHTLYDQVLEHARREIDDASAKIDELRGTLALLEARVEASKSVYEAVAARLNLEDEGNLPQSAYGAETGALSETAYPEAPPRLEELEAEDVSAPPVEAAVTAVPPPPQAAPEPLPAATPEPPAPSASAVESTEPPAAVSEAPAEAPPVDGNGTHNDSGGDVSMDLIRQHLEQRAQRNQSELQVTPRPAPTISPAPVVETAEMEAPDMTAPAVNPLAAEATDVEDEDASQNGESDSQTVGFPGLSESDRRLIEEHMRRRAEANQDR